MAKRTMAGRTIGATILMGLMVLACAAHGQLLSKSKLYVGALSCSVSGSVGFLFGSTKTLNCILVRPDGTSETYGGSINRYGIDIGFTKAMHVVWHVYTLNEVQPPPGTLAGNYIGGQESVAVGATAGGNTLIGGVNQAIVLTSVAIQGSKSGFNFADGIAEMSLSAATY
jgi:hypothetical protein